jgi:2-dehydropantoate 2-reductase
MKIGIIGIGSVGSVYGSFLSKSNSDTLLFTRRNEHAKSINENGIIIQNSGGNKRYFPNATNDYEKLADRELIILLVKTYDLEGALEEIKKYCSQKGIILSLQNGLGIIETISSWFDISRLVAGITYIGAKKISDQETILGNNLKMVIGEPSGSMTDRLGVLSDLFQTTGFEVEISSHINQSIWEKMLIVACQNALGALTGLTIGQMFDSPYCQQIIRSLFEEVKQVGQAAGVDLREKSFDDLIKNAILLKDHRSSMWQDIHAQRKTEIDSINGFIAKLGRQNNKPTPYNEIITNLIHISESIRNS